MVKKILLKYPIKLKIGSWIKEVSRFNKNNYIIYKIESINYNYNEMELKVIEDSIHPELKDKYHIADISAHYNHKNSKWLTYYLPIPSALYEEVT